MPRVPPSLILDGHGAYALPDSISVTVITLDRFTDAQVIQLGQDCYDRAGGYMVTGAISHLLGGVPDSRQRKLLADHLTTLGVQKVHRNCLLTNQIIMRGALTAYGWLVGARTAGFAPHERDRALRWLAGASKFDHDLALEYLTGCYELLGVPLPAP